MANLSTDDVFKLAQLARLDLDADEAAAMAEELSAILGYVEQLQAVEVGDRKPTNQVTGLTNVTRPDVVRDYGYQPEGLRKNLPAAEDGHIKVKRMLG